MVLVSRAESSTSKLQLKLNPHKMAVIRSFSDNYSDSPTSGFQKSAFISMSLMRQLIRLLHKFYFCIISYFLSFL